MAIQVTVWSPDTCGCSISYSWDDTVPAVSRVHTPAAFDSSRCPLHNHPDLATAWARLQDENPRKNKMYATALSWLAAHVPSMVVTDAEGNQSIKPGSFTFAYDATGLLTIGLPGLTAAQRAQVQVVADSQFGVGKIKVV